MNAVHKIVKNCERRSQLHLEKFKRCIRSAVNMIEDFEVDWDLFEVKKKLLKFERKHKTGIYF